MQKEKDKKINGSVDPEENLKKLKELKAKAKKEVKAKIRKKVSLG